jgi:hypothetical protein
VKVDAGSCRHRVVPEPRALLHSQVTGAKRAHTEKERVDRHHDQCCEPETGKSSRDFLDLDTLIDGTGRCTVHVKP